MLSLEADIVKAIGIAGGVGLATLLARYLKRRGAEALGALRRIEGALPTLLLIAEQLRPNGGATLRDRVDAISDKLTFQEGARRMLVDLAFDAPFYECDASGGCVYVNRAWSTITGLSLEEARGAGWVQGIYPSDRANVLEEWNAAVEQGREFALDYRMVHTSGVVTTVSGRTRVLRDARGSVVGMVGVNRVLETD